MTDRVLSLRARDVAGLWLASRAALVLFVGLTAVLVGLDRERRRAGFSGWLFDRFSWADSYHYLRIAEKGYLPPGLPCCDQAFFPGYPLAIRAVAPLTGGNLTAAGLLVSFAASTVAAVLLWQLATALHGPRVAGIAVLLLAVAPYGVFLTSVFTESLFLALGIGAWWAAYRRAWWWAGLLVGLATLVRVNGVFLAAGLAVLYVVQVHGDRSGAEPGHAPRPVHWWRLRPRPDVLALLAPVVAVGGYTVHLWSLTGSWTAWTDAQIIGWGRRTAWPWDGFVAGWNAIVGAQGPDFLVAYTADLVTSVLGVVLVVVLLRLRRWDQATYVGLNVLVLVCSTTLQSAPRYALTWFPVYLLIAEWAQRRHWAPTGLVLLGGPLMAGVAVALAAHLWVA